MHFYTKFEIISLVVMGVLISVLILRLCQILGHYTDYVWRKIFTKKKLNEKAYLSYYISAVSDVRVSLEALLSGNYGLTLQQDECAWHERNIEIFFTSLLKDYPGLSWDKISGFAEVVEMYVLFLNPGGEYDSGSVKNHKSFEDLMHRVITPLRESDRYSENEA